MPRPMTWAAQLLFLFLDFQTFFLNLISIQSFHGTHSAHNPKVPAYNAKAFTERVSPCPEAWRFNPTPTIWEQQYKYPLYHCDAQLITLLDFDPQLESTGFYLFIDRKLIYKLPLFLFQTITIEVFVIFFSFSLQNRVVVL